MPLDLRRMLEQREQELSGLISGFEPETRTGLASLTSGIEARRGADISGLAGLSGIDPAALMASGQRTQNLLGRRLSALTEGRLANVRRGSAGLRLDQAFRKTDRARQFQSAEETAARQEMFDEIARRRQEADLERQSASRRDMEREQESLTSQGIVLQDKYQGGGDYDAALYRALFGLTGQLGTAWALNKFDGGSSSSTNNQGTYAGWLQDVFRSQDLLKNYGPQSTASRYGQDFVWPGRIAYGR